MTKSWRTTTYSSVRPRELKLITWSKKNEIGRLQIFQKQRPLMKNSKIGLPILENQFDRVGNTDDNFPFSAPRHDCNF